MNLRVVYCRWFAEHGFYPWNLLWLLIGCAQHPHHRTPCFMDADATTIPCCRTSFSEDGFYAWMYDPAGLAMAADWLL